MIKIENKFDNEFLKIEFSGVAIEPKIISVPTLNDVNFKDLIDYLIELIPIGEELAPTFEYNGQTEGKDKLKLIEDTMRAICIKFNESIKRKSDDGGIEESETEVDEIF